MNTNEKREEIEANIRLLEENLQLMKQELALLDTEKKNVVFEKIIL